MFNTYRDQVTWQNDLALGERNSLLLGGDWYEDRVHASTDFTEDSRWNRAVFVQHRYQASTFPPKWVCAMTVTSSSAARPPGAAA